MPTAASVAMSSGRGTGKTTLSKALAQKTPLGDAARADWQRLQPLDITYVSFIIYNWKLFLGSPMEEFAFGGDARSVA